MNIWVKPGVSVGCVVLACIISAIASSGGTSNISVGAGAFTPTAIENIATYNDMINEVVAANNKIVSTVGGSAANTDAINNSVTSYTLTESSNVGISYSIKASASSTAISYESMATRKIQLAITENEWYCNSDIISLYNKGDGSGLVSVDISAETYISIVDKVCYMNVHRFNVLKEGYTTSAPTSAIDKWFAFDADVLNRASSSSIDTAELLISYVMSAYSDSAFARIINTYVSLYSSDKFSVSGTEYILRDTYLSEYASSMANVSIPKDVGVSGKFSVNLASSASPVMTTNYSCQYSTSTLGVGASLNAYENDKLVFENINNTVINNTAAIRMTGGAMELSEYIKYWGIGLK